MKPRDPKTRRDRRPRRAQGDKAPRSSDFPTGREGAQSYFVKDIPEDILTAFDKRAQKADRSRRWTILALMEKYANGDITL